MVFSFVLGQQSISNTSNEDSDAKVVSLSEDVTKLTDERNTLQDRVKKANEENLNLIDKVHVRKLFIYYIYIFCYE
jgi:uncharacterized protein YlxW (UPF0749 family)